jgi:enhanced entry protein LpnE
MKRLIAISLTLISLSAFAAGFDEGWEALHQEKFEKAEATFRGLDKQGDAKGAFGLGVMHQNGYGKVPQNNEIAMRLYRKAAQANVPAAIHNIGYMYQHGAGVDKDLTEAVNWYTKAANLGFATSQYDLAFMYYHGWGVKQDVKKAFSLFKQAADAGLPESISNVGHMYAQGEGVGRDNVLAYAYLKSAGILGQKIEPKQLAWFENRLSRPDLEKANAMTIELTSKKMRPHEIR